MLVASCLPARGLAATPPAAGSPAAAVEVSQPTCTAVSLPLVAFLDSLRVELAGRGLTCCILVDSDAVTPAPTSLRVTLEVSPCTGGGDTVQISVLDATNGRAQSREVTLADVAEAARPRALALVVAELIRSLGQAVQQPPPAPVAVVGASPPPSLPPPVTAKTQPALSIHLEGETRFLPTRDTTLWGGRLRFTFPWRAFHADLDLGGGFASNDSELGGVVLRTASLGLTVGPRLATSIAVVDLGLRAEVGWTFIHGEPGLANVQSGAGSDVASSVGLRASVDSPVRARLHPSLAVEGGAVLHGVKGEANGHPVVGMTGYYLLAALGIAVSL